MEATQQSEHEVLRRKLDLLLRTGQLLMESSADTSRILRNMERTAAYLGLPEKQLHIYITYDMLMSEPSISPQSRPVLPLLGPRFTKLRVHTAMMPPIATAQSSLRGMLNIIEKPMADIAAAMA